MNLDYSKLGLKVGIEIHQQLDTDEKLFCFCRADLSSEEPEITFARRLRPTESELGEVDPAALFEFKRGKAIVYEADRSTSCLVEEDEEPPHDLNRDALEVCLTASLLMGARPVDEVHVMRKIVIDGSTPFGFQRTSIVALNGEINVEGSKVAISAISVEEDAARKMKETETEIHYRLDRLGIPLIEVATDPIEAPPNFIGKVALAIGRILRATKRVKRGLGTIRQDLNISISSGGLVEIKGAQELDLLPKIIELEVQRQLGLLEVRDALKKRGITKEALDETFVDVTDLFKETKCKIIRSTLNKGGRVLAVTLRSFGGLLGRELIPGVRFGTELSDRAKFWGRVGGIFHTDELPVSGVTAEETSRLKHRMSCGEGDAVVIVADKAINAKDALRAVVKRSREALEGIPGETRGPRPDGTTKYERPRPGSARMYPETDVPSIVITDGLMKRLRNTLPELPEQLTDRLMKQYRLNSKLANQLLDSDYLPLFEKIASATSLEPSVVASILTETMKALGRDGVNVGALSDSQIEEAFRVVNEGSTSKESLPETLRWLANNLGKSAADAIKALGLASLKLEDLDKIVDEVLREKAELVNAQGVRALGPLMGAVMQRVRGKVDGKLVNDRLKERLSRVLKK